MGCPRLTYHQNPSPLKVVYSAKSRYQKIGANVLYFGARYYDSEVSVWLSVDPMSDERLWVSPYSYVQRNPLNRIDPTGMLDQVDDFYFDQDGKLIKYIENDEPDRVYVATGNTNVDPEDPNMVPEPEFKQVEMSAEEIEQKMDGNGYKKVTSKVEVTNNQTETTVSTGKFGSKTIINGTEVTVGIDEKYVKKDKVPVGRANRVYLDYDPESLAFQKQTYEAYREDVIYGNKERSSFVDWFIKYCTSVDSRIKYEINTHW